MAPSINDSTVLALKHPDGWYVGTHGPFASIHSGIAANDACGVVVVASDGLSMLIIDGVPLKAHPHDESPMRFHGCSFVKTNSGRMLVRAWNPAPNKPEGQAERHEYFVTRKSVHGPFIGTRPAKDFYDGAFIVQKANDDERRQRLYFEDEVHEPSSEFKPFTDAHGERYLLCRSTRTQHSLGQLFGKKGLLSGFCWADTSSGIAVVLRASALHDDREVFIGGRLVNAFTRVDSIHLHMVGRNLMQCVRYRDEKGRCFVQLYRNAGWYAGPYDSIADLEITPEGRITFTALDTDDLGIQRYRHCSGLIPTGL